MKSGEMQQHKDQWLVVQVDFFQRDFIGTIQLAKNTLSNCIGKHPNIVFMGQQCLGALLNSKGFLERTCWTPEAVEHIPCSDRTRRGYLEAILGLKVIVRSMRDDKHLVVAHLEKKLGQWMSQGIKIRNVA